MYVGPKETDTAALPRLPAFQLFQWIQSTLMKESTRMSHHTEIQLHKTEEIKNQYHNPVGRAGGSHIPARTHFFTGVAKYMQNYANWVLYKWAMSELNYIDCDTAQGDVRPTVESEVCSSIPYLISLQK